MTPWILAPWWPTREPHVDLKWPFVALGLLLFAGASFFEPAARTDWEVLRRDACKLGLIIGSLLIVVGLMASTLASPARSLGFQVTLRESLFVLAAVRIATLAPKRKAVTVLLAGYLVSASLQAALTLLQWQRSGGLRGAMLGTLGNPEYVAGWLAPAFAIAMIWATRAGVTMKQRLLLGAAALLAGGSIVLSGGRGAALGAVAGIAAPWLALRFGGKPAERKARAAPAAKRSRRAVWIASAAAALIIVVLATVLGPRARHQSLFGRMAEVFDPYSISIRHRIGLMVVTSHMIARNPVLGAGPGRFGAAFDTERGELARESGAIGQWVFNDFMSDRTATEAHCDPLQWWAEYGLLPFLGLAMIIAGTLASLIAQIRAAPDQLIPKLLLAALVVIIVGMLFAFPLHRPTRAVLFWVLVGISNGQNGQDGPDGQNG